MAEFHATVSQAQAVCARGYEYADLIDGDYAGKIDRICEINTKMTQIQTSYYKKMYKVVPAQKVYKAMLAEDAFHRMMLRQLDQRRKDNHHRK